MKDLRSSKPLGFRGVALIATAIGAVAVGALPNPWRETSLLAWHLGSFIKVFSVTKKIYYW